MLQRAFNLANRWYDCWLLISTCIVTISRHEGMTTCSRAITLPIASSIGLADGCFIPAVSRRPISRVSLFSNCHAACASRWAGVPFLSLAVGQWVSRYPWNIGIADRAIDRASRDGFENSCDLSCSELRKISRPSCRLNKGIFL